MCRRLFVLICFAICMLCPAAFSAPANGPVSAGVADLRPWTLEQCAVLDGDWEFYWQQNIQPGQLSKQKSDLQSDPVSEDVQEYARVGVPWESQFKQLMPIYGHATYRLKVLLPEAAINLPLMLRTQFVASRFKCYANGELMGQNGLSVDPNLDSGSYVNTFKPFVSQTSELELLCQVSNHELIRGGLSRHLELAPASRMSLQNTRFHTLFSLIEGVLLFACFYHLVLFWLRRREKMVLWFGLICATTLIYYDSLLVHNLEYLVAEIPYAWTLAAGRISVYLAMCVLALYMRELLPKDFSPTYLRVLLWVCGLASVALLFAPAGFVQAYALLYLLWAVSLVNEAYSLFVLLRAYYYRRPDVGLFLFSSAFYFLTSIHDVLEDARVIVSVPFLSAVGLTIFCLSQSIFIARRFSRAFEQTEVLSAELQHVNQNLEFMVAARTQELEAKNQDLEALLHFKQNLTQMLVHDLKNPLGAILGFAQTRRVPAERALKNIFQSGHRMLALIQNLLDIQWIEDTQMQLNKQSIKLQSLVASVCEQMLFLSEKTPVIQQKIDPLLRVEADAQVLERVLLNLISNAIKHTPSTGQITIHAELKGHQLEIVVSDTGRGIPAAELPHIFDKFRRGPQTGLVQSSSGLGLTFCKLAITAHGGEIKVSSEQGQGTQVYLLLAGGLSTSESFSCLPLKLAEAEQKRLQLVIQQLKRLDVYEISEIRQVLRQLDAASLGDSGPVSAVLNQWLDQLQLILDSFDNQLYQRFLESSEMAEISLLP